MIGEAIRGNGIALGSATLLQSELGRGGWCCLMRAVLPAHGGYDLI